MSSPLAPLTVAGGVVVLLIAIHRPLLVCIGFVAFSLFRLHEAFPFLMPLQPLLGLAALTAVALVYNALAGRIEAVWPAEIRLFVAFFILVTIGSVFAISPALSFEFWTGGFVKIGLMTLALAWLPRTKDDFHLVARVIAISGLLVAAVAISNKLNGTNLVEGTRVTIGLQMTSILSDPNDLAFLLLTTLSFSIALLTGRTGWTNRIIGAACVPAVLLAIVYTQSRGAVLGVLTVFAAYGLLFVRSKTVLIVACIIGAMALYLAMGISERMSRVAPAEGFDASAADRLDFWITALKAAALRPLTGVGLANFSWFNYIQTGQDMTTHNTWLQVLAETGIPGLALFVLMVARAFRTSLRAHRILSAAEIRSPVQPVAYGLVAAIAGFCTAGLFLSQGFTWSIYIMVALAAAVGRYVDENTRMTVRTGASHPRGAIHDMAPYRGN
ncbi:O-antigen ligase [Microvirga sp. KLBC 81]|uniref:O-antigen ligase family protein n=1 Tax=Microvirga sp. KLBC 81 TaxID=1862707 RepID=UPI00197C5FC8|nr:O-antigen ligase family protein [Microvirga sp. KLBC 81]